ncbi:MAG: pyroglutamyl-peptidase I [Pirellulaceae bacterium]
MLLTAFEPYDEWTENSSWLTLVELLKARPTSVELLTRRYPVDLNALQSRLVADLEKKPDVVLHLGQSPGAAAIKLEAVALNVAGCVDENGQELPPLVDAGSLAFQSAMPLGRWAEMLRQAGIPAVVSYHAGTFLCNATMYLTHHWCQVNRHPIQVGFVHLPLSTEQVAGSGRSLPSRPLATLAQAVRLLIEDLAERLAD